MMQAAMLRGDTGTAMGLMNRSVGEYGMGMYTSGTTDFSTASGQQMVDFMERQYKMRTGQELNAQAMYQMGDTSSRSNWAYWI